MNLLLALLLVLPINADTLQVEAEDAELIGGVTVETTREGYSGTGYATGFDEPGDSLRFEVETGEGIHEIFLGMAAPGRLASVDVWVDGEAVQTSRFGTGGNFVERKQDEVFLAEGTHAIVVRGDIDVDYLKLVRQAHEGPTVPSSALSDAEATEVTQALYQFLLDQYGEHILAGQQTLDDIRYVENVTGRTPAVGSFDLIDYSPTRVECQGMPQDDVEQWIDWAGTRGIVNLMWHWNAPTDLIDDDCNPANDGEGQAWWSGFYTEATTFDFAEALADTTSEEYELLLRDIDVIAAQLQKFEDADMPVLWRPLHEAAGGWFWWGAQGPEPFVELWRLMYDRLVNHHEIHNLLWVYTHEPDASAWYPGDAYVDVVGRDVYADDPRAVMQGDWNELQQLYGGRKLVALTETGTVPDPEVITAYGIWWSWFAPWTGDYIRDVDQDYLRRVYESEVVLTRDELPTWRPDPGLGIVSFTAEPPEIEAGQTSTLAWTVTGAASVTLNDSLVEATGTATVSPDTTTTYTLVATDEAGFATRAVTVAVLDPSQINRARLQPAVASTEEACCGPVLTADLAVDGDPDTRWSSAWRSEEEGGDPNLDDDPGDEWIYVDLGDTYDLREVVLHWEAAYGEDYDIDVSFDGYLWQTVREVHGSDGGVDSVRFYDPEGMPTVWPSARYVRMHGITRATEYGYSLWEFEVYGLESEVSPPLVAFTAPHEGAFVAPGTDVPVAANASDADGTVQHVSFYLNGDSLGAVEVEAEDESYSTTLESIPEGVHELTAIVTDDHGLRVMTAPFMLYAMGTDGFRRFEAEDASYTGSVSEASGSNASGGAYLDMTGPPDAGTITFDEIYAPEAGDYLLAFGYNLNYDSPKSQFIVVNGDTLTELRFEGAAGTWLERGLEVPLQEGPNAVAIDWSWGWMYVDYLAVQGVTSTAAEDELGLPAAVTFGKSYPNPFTERATVPLSLPETGPVRLEVFDLTGRRVAVLLDGVRPAGSHTVSFEAKGLASGLYVLRLTAGSTVKTQPVVLMR